MYEKLDFKYLLPSLRTIIRPYILRTTLYNLQTAVMGFNVINFTGLPSIYFKSFLHCIGSIKNIHMYIYIYIARGYKESINESQVSVILFPNAKVPGIRLFEVSATYPKSI